MIVLSTPNPSHGISVSTNAAEPSRVTRLCTYSSQNVKFSGFSRHILSREMLQISLQKRNRHHAAFMVLPTAQPERAATTEKPLPNWSARAVKSFCMGMTQAKKMKYLYTGTESLLMGILEDGTSAASKLLRANGINLSTVKKASTEVLGLSDYYTPVREAPPPTKTLLKALDQAFDDAMQSGKTDEVTTTHMLLAIWATRGSAGQQILAKLGFDDKMAEALAHITDEVNWPPK